MPNSHVLIKTVNASKYLKQLCKHFAHKVDVEFDDFKAKVAFPPGPCVMKADEFQLTISCTSESPEGLEVMQSIIDQHLVKFAWREEFQLDWTSTSDRKANQDD